MDFPVTLVDPEGKECLCGSMTSYVDLVYGKGYHLKPSGVVEVQPEPQKVDPLAGQAPPTKPAPAPEPVVAPDDTNK